MSITFLKEYNIKLIKSNEDISITDYFNHVTEHITNLDNAFVKLYLYIIDYEDEFILKDELLYKYGIIKNGDIESVKRLFLDYGAISGVDYISDYELDLDLNTTSFKITEHFYITPKFFKMMLVKSTNIEENPYIENIYLLKRIDSYYYKYRTKYAEKEAYKNHVEIVKLTKELSKLRHELNDVNNLFRKFKINLVDKLKMLEQKTIEKRNTTELKKTVSSNE